jgi:general secretion pathway protein G
MTSVHLIRRQKTFISSRRAAFTLLEVLLVLIILGVIAALVVPNLLGTQERSYINATKSSIKGLEQTMKIYSVDHEARFPQSIDDLLKPVDAQGQEMKPYLDEYPKDAWGNRINYELATEGTAGAKPRIWSNGLNEQNDDGGGDDINNWTTTDEQ